MLEGWKYDVRNLWWTIDYNRQSLDGVVSDGLFRKIQEFFRTVDWQVVTLKYGKKLQRVFAQPGGDALEKRSEEHTSELQSLMRISYAVFCLKKKNNIQRQIYRQAGKVSQAQQKTK